MRLSTCKGCGKKLQPDEKKTHGGKTYCFTCFEKISADAEAYKNLIEKVHNLAESTEQTFNSIVYKQVKKYHDEFNFTYGGISYTLWYIENVLGKQLDLEKYGIALVQYEYNNAQKWYNIQMQRRASANNITSDPVVCITSFNHVDVQSQTINLDKLLERM
jgi:uncharacterized Zn finger protein (UPF0148 family)